MAGPDYEFTIPDCSGPRAITGYALQRLDVIIAAYQDFNRQLILRGNRPQGAGVNSGCPAAFSRSAQVPHEGHKTGDYQDQ